MKPRKLFQMKILLDENLPVKLKLRFVENGFDAFTVKDMNWLGKQNGDLLQLMLKENFEVFVTIDNNLSFQQNFRDYPVQVIVLISHDNTYPTLFNNLSKIISALQTKWIGAKAVLLND